MMMHGPFTNGIDTGRRFAARVHGIDTRNLNLIHYVGDLIDDAQHRHPKSSRWGG